MHITIINDCHDDNAAGRQLARTAALTGATVSMLGVGDYGDLSAAGNLIDILDANRDIESGILVNVAPRHKGSKKWPNGTPFCYFSIGKTTIVSSFDGLTLSLIKKLGLVEQVFLMDIPEVTAELVKGGVIAEDERERITRSQFRSFDFTPRVMAELVVGRTVLATEVSINDIPDAPKGVWWIDNFGNVKTTLVESDGVFVDDEIVQTRYGALRCYRHLADVSKGEAALIIGSSGYGNDRFIEIVVQGGRADTLFNIKIGDSVGSD